VTYRVALISYHAGSVLDYNVMIALLNFVRL
jgi:hypothetical protein